MGQWLETLTQWLAANPQWLGLALVIVACMECLAVVGLIVPGTVMVFAIAVLAGNGVLTLGYVPSITSSATALPACWSVASSARCGRCCR